MAKNGIDADMKFVFGGKSNDQYGIPPLPYGYSYLLLLKGDIGIVDIYKWLAEIIFFSHAKEKNKIKPLNIISFFIDDHSKNLAFSTMGDKYVEGDPMEGCLEKLVKQPKPHNFVVNTFASFGKAQFKPTKIVQNIRAYNLVGAGNPMQMMRVFSQICETPNDQVGDLNCIMINSISNLCRSMGLRDAMAMIRAMLERAVWKADGDSNDGAPPKSRLLDNDGLLFAVLHEKIFSEQEIQYAKTFFDGIVEFEGILDNDTNNDEEKKPSYEKKIGYSVIGLPGLNNRDHKVKFGKLRRFIPSIGGRLELVEEDKIEDCNEGDQVNE